MTKDRLTARVTTIANALLIGGGGVCLLVLLYFLYHYSWTGDRRFTSWTGVFLYYAVPGLSASLLLYAAARLRPSAKVNLAFLLCSTLGGFYALECAFTVWTALPSVENAAWWDELAEAAEASGSLFDTRSLSEVVRDLRSQGINAQPTVAPSIQLLEEVDGETLRSVISIDGVEVLPLAPMSNQLTVLCNENGEYVIYDSDEHGFNNPPGIWGNRPIDVVALGDSFVQGHCVAADRSFVAEIRREYPATLGLGIQGNGTLVMLATFREYVATLKPKVVLWFYFENDIGDLRRENRSALLRRYRTDDRFRQDLVHRQPQIDLALDDYIETLLERSTLSIKLAEIADAVSDLSRSPSAILRVLKLGELRTRLGLVLGESADEIKLVWDEKETLDLFADIISSARRDVDEWGGQMYFVFLPGAERYIDGAFPDANRDEVIEIAFEAGLPVIDVHESFLKHPDPLSLFPFRLNHHYTEEGHRLVAETVLRAISAGEPTRNQ